MSGQSDSVKMLALGRQFQIGTLYNYVEDKIVPNVSLWDPDDVSKSASVKDEIKRIVNVHKTSNKNEIDKGVEKENEKTLLDLGMDDHSAISVTAGLISPAGAWQYVGNRTVGQEVVVHCRCSSKKISVDPTKLEIICRQEKVIKSQATHVVMAITYGLEAFCIFPQQKQEEDEKESTNEILNYANVFADGLVVERNQLEPYEDEESDEEDENYRLIPLDLHCILYSDWLKVVNKKGPSWTSLPVTEQYEACKKVMDHQVNKAVPLKIWLYPLDKLIDRPIDNLTEFKTDVRQDLVIRYQLFKKQWQIIQNNTGLLIQELDTLNKDWLPSNVKRRITNLDECIKIFGSILLKYLAEWTVSVRRGDDVPQKKMEDIVKAIQYNSPFIPNEICDWINHQKQQIKTLELLTNLPNIRLETEIDKLGNQIKTGGIGSFSVVLCLPSLAEKSNGIVNKLKSYITKFSEAQFSSWRQQKKTGQLKSPANRRQIFNSGLEFSNWVTEHNKETANVQYIIFYDELFGAGKKITCIKLYDGSGEVICPNFTIPKAIEEIKIERNKRGIVILSWIDENKIDQSSYLVQYCRADSPGQHWESIKESSNSITFNYLQSEESYVFRVAVMTPGGRSPFSPISQHVTVDPICPTPNGLHLRYATDMSLTIDWDHQVIDDEVVYIAADDENQAEYYKDDQNQFNYGEEDEYYEDDNQQEYYEGSEDEYEDDYDYYEDDDQYQDDPTNQEEVKESIKISSYSVECWKEGCQDSTLIQRSTKEKTITLEPLDLGTFYCIEIRAVCIDSSGSVFYSSASSVLKVCTLKEAERPAVVARHISKKCSSDEDIDTFQLPLKKHEIATAGVGYYSFGEPSYLALAGKRRQRTILMLGATGSGKSTLINAMVNYVLGVEWNDNFRLKLIDESTDKSQAHSQTDLVTTYNLYEMKGSRLNYSLTVVDTPGFGDTRGLEKDKKIMEQIQDYFKSHNGIQQLEAVCFVVQSSLPRLTATQQYIFDSVLSIFGQDVKENIRLMVTFADNAQPPVLEAVKEVGIPTPIDPKTGLSLHHKFNNSIFFTPNRLDRKTNEINRIYFDLAVENFDKFFDDLGQMEATSLTLTREVLDERKRLEALVEGLQIRTQLKLTRVDELEQIKRKLAENRDQIEANNNFEFEVEFLVPKSTDISGTGQFTTNCQTCQLSCHFPCRQASDENKHLCSVMDSSGTCTICKCHWSNHFSQKFRYEMVMEKVKRSSNDIRKQYQLAQTQLLTNEQLLSSVENDIKEKETQLMELMQAIYPHIQRLDEIALRPHPFTTPEYIDLMIEAEKKEHRQGYQQRIFTLQKLRQNAEIMGKLIRDNSKTYQTSISDFKPQIQEIPASTTGNAFTNFFATLSRVFKNSDS